MARKCFSDGPFVYKTTNRNSELVPAILFPPPPFSSGAKPDPSVCVQAGCNAFGISWRVRSIAVDPFFAGPLTISTLSLIEHIK